MRIELLRPHANYRAGRVIDHPWRHVAVALITAGIARAIDAPDLHLNPPATSIPADSPSAVEPGAMPEASPPAPETRSARRRR